MDKSSGAVRPGADRFSYLYGSLLRLCKPSPGTTKGGRSANTCQRPSKSHDSVTSLWQSASLTEQVTQGSRRYRPKIRSRTVNLSCATK